MFMKHVRETILSQTWDTEITCKFLYDVVPPPALPWGMLSLEDFEPFLAFIQKALLSGLAWERNREEPIWPALSTLDLTNVTFSEMLSSHSLYRHPALFSFTTLITTCHIFICYMFVFSSLECNVHESRVFAHCRNHVPTTVSDTEHTLHINWMNEQRPCPQDFSSLGEEQIKSPIVLSKCKNNTQEAVREERKGTRTRQEWMSGEYYSAETEQN